MHVIKLSRRPRHAIDATPARRRGGAVSPSARRQLDGVRCGLSPFDSAEHLTHWLICAQVGEVVVFKIKDRDIPIVHRVMKVHEKASGAVELLTKGDNNRVDDRGLYAPGQLWLERDDVLGRAVGTLRYVGMVTIILNDYPALKYVLVSIMGLFVLTNKEEA